MKPGSAIACLFAAYGLYLVLSNLLAVCGWVLAMFYGNDLPHEMRFIQWMSVLVLTLPLLVGVLLVRNARQLGQISAKFAGLDPDETWNLNVNASQLCAILLCGVGAWFVVSGAAAIVKTAVLLFITRAGDQSASFQAGRGLGHASEIITHIALLVGGIVLMKKSRRISTALGF